MEQILAKSGSSNHFSVVIFLHIIFGSFVAETCPSSTLIVSRPSAFATGLFPKDLLVGVSDASAFSSLPFESPPSIASYMKTIKDHYILYIIFFVNTYKFRDFGV